LDAIRRSGIRTKFYQASSSELFGSALPPQSEITPFAPQSPYAIAKLYSYWIARNYRDAYGLYACNGILFNHESPRRGETFVTRKITRAIAAILAGRQEKLYIGNMYSKRDWGFAPEYVEMMWLMLNQDKPEDYVVGTGESHTVKEFISTAFAYCDIELEWKGSGIAEKGIVKSIGKEYQSNIKTGSVLIEIDPNYFRPTEVDFLQADISKAQKQLGWSPKVKFSELVEIMTDFDLQSHGLPAPMRGIESIRMKGIDWTEHKTVQHLGGRQ